MASVLCHCQVTVEKAQDKYILESRDLKTRGLLREHNERLVCSLPK